MARPISRARGPMRQGRIATRRLALPIALVLLAAPAEDASATFPGGNGKIAFDSTRDGNFEVYAMEPDGTNPTRLTTNAAADRNPAWSRDAAKIAFESERTGGGDIYVMDADGQNQTRLTNSPFPDLDPAWSPDGTKVAFSSSRADGDPEVYVINVDGTGEVALTDNGAQLDSHPSWSPDGTKIAFTSEREVEPGEVKVDVFVMNADGSGQVALTSERDRAIEDLQPSWSPDGEQIVFASSGSEFALPPVPAGLVVMDATGSGKANVTEDQADAYPSWSPDGQKIAFESQRPGNFDVFAMDAGGSNVVNLTSNAALDRRPDWQPLDSDGDALPDDWETNGVDTNGDSTIDLDLPAMGADPHHKDIFIEVDFIAGHAIAQAQVNAVVDAFKAAPVPNPDGQPGINLHVDNGPGSVMDPDTSATWGALSDQDSLTHQNVLGADFVVGPDTIYDWSEFEAIRQTKLLAIRRPAFHYVIAAHSGPAQRFAGIARGIPGADFIIAMHENCTGPIAPLATECAPHPDYTAATFMHEFGHVLGLRHGGTENAAHKPNYLSVMNYNFGYGLVLSNGTFALDYNRFEFPLNENALDEEIGFAIDSGPLTAFRTIYRCPNDTTKEVVIPLTTRTVDWNCDGDITGIGTVRADVSKDAQITDLKGPLDWGRIVFAGGGIGALAQPPQAATTVIDEPTPAELLENRAALDAGPEPPLPLPGDPDSTPPQTTIDKAPKKRLTGSKTKVSFSSNEPGSSFECKLDKKPFKGCSSPKKLKKLKPGKHRFQVRATDAAGNTDQSPAKAGFKVVRKR